MNLKNNSESLGLPSSEMWLKVMQRVDGAT